MIHVYAVHGKCRAFLTERSRAHVLTVAQLVDAIG